MDEVNQGQDTLEAPAGPASPASNGDEPAAEAQPAETSPVAELELAAAEARLLHLEQALSARDGEIASLKERIAELESDLATTSSTLADAVSSYRRAVLGDNPEVMEELVHGDSVEAIDQSLAQAKQLISRVREGLEAEVSLARVPVGAPERRSADLSALSPQEKIRYAIGSKR